MARHDRRQPVLRFRKRGGTRPGAGRKRARRNEGLLPHRARPEFVARVPVHATLRALPSVPRFRSERVMRIMRGEIRRVSKDGFRILHYSVQDNHVHLIAEGDDAACFARGMQRFASRIARWINMLAVRRGQLWRERYHRRDLATPRQFRNALVYVLQNHRKHARPAERALRARLIDGCSSGVWLDEWSSGALRARVREERSRAGPRPTVAPKTWIARTGWKRHGRIDPREAPRTPT
jgi:hypothetical protein